VSHDETPHALDVAEERWRGQRPKCDKCAALPLIFLPASYPCDHDAPLFPRFSRSAVDDARSDWLPVLSFANCQEAVRIRSTCLYVHRSKYRNRALAEVFGIARTTAVERKHQAFTTVRMITVRLHRSLPAGSAVRPVPIRRRSIVGYALLRVNGAVFCSSHVTPPRSSHHS